MNLVAKHRITLAAALATLALSATALALDPHTPLAEYGRRLWRFEEGLPSETARAFAQTKDGYLWIGTPEGVARFDGVRFVTMGDFGSKLRGAWINTMAIDRDGVVWFGGSDPGLSRYRDGKVEIIHELDRFGTHDVMSLAAAPDGSLWLGTSVGVIRRRVNGTLELWSAANVLPNPNVTALLSDRRGDLWIGTEGGLAKLSNGRIQRVSGLPPRSIRSLYEDWKGRLWIGTNQGAFCLDGGRFVDQPALRDIDHQYVASILEDNRHTLWFGTSSGLKRLASDGTSEPLSAAGLASSFIRALFHDREGNLWVGTMEGINQLRDTAFKNFGPAQGLPDRAVLTLAEDRSGAMWLGFYDGLARLAAGKTTLFDRNHGLPNASILSMAPSRRGGVWAGTWGGGLCYVNSGPPRCLGSAEGLSSGVIRSVYEDEDGSVWLAPTGGGLNRVSNGQVEVFGAAAGFPPDYEINVIAPARNGGLWLGGSPQGLMLFRHGHVERTFETSREPSYPNQIQEDSDGNVWIAFDESGLGLLRNGKITHVSLPSFGDSPALLSIVDDGRGFLWLTTPHHIVRVEKQEVLAYAGAPGRLIHTIVCGPSDGMISSAFARNGGGSIRARDGSLWFNGSAGAARLVPSDLGSRPSVPPVALIESVTSHDRPLTGSHPTIDRDAGQLVFRFTAVNFSDPANLSFRYMLEGFDDGWSPAGKARTATYANLPPGDYVFRVMAAGADDKWNEAVSASYRFSRRPTFTETRWFVALCSLGLFAIILLVYGIRVKALKGRELELSQRVQEQTRTLQRLSAKHHTILSSAGDGIVGLDASGSISFINPSGAQMLGWEVDSLLGMSLHQIIHASEDETAGPAETCFVCGPKAAPAVRVMKADLFRSRSGNFPVELTSSTITTEAGGSPAGVVITFRDITERQQLERMKSEFVSTVSHELRTPLTSMRGALGLLASGLTGELPPRARRMVEIAVANSDRLVRLTNDILDIERIDSGQVELERREVDGETLVRQAAEVMQPMADRAGVILRVETAPGGVNVDPDRVTQVITNLLSNAIKFSRPQTTVTLAAGRIDGVFTIRVSDEGRGIPAAKLGSIFERFQQVDASDARDKGGTGLGLAICRSIVRAHGGDITVESAMTVGSTFYVRLPDPAEEACYLPVA